MCILGPTKPEPISGDQPHFIDKKDQKVMTNPEFQSNITCWEKMENRTVLRDFLVSRTEIDSISNYSVQSKI